MNEITIDDICTQDNSVIELCLLSNPHMFYSTLKEYYTVSIKCYKHDVIIDGLDKKIFKNKKMYL